MDASPLPQGHLHIGAQLPSLVLFGRQGQQGIGGAGGFLVVGERQDGERGRAALPERFERPGEVVGEPGEVRFLVLEAGNQVAEVDPGEFGQVPQHRVDVHVQPQFVGVAAQVVGEGVDLLVGQGADRLRRQDDLDVGGHERLGHGQVREEVAGDRGDRRVDEHLAVEAVVRRRLVQDRPVVARRQDGGADRRGSHRQHAQRGQHERHRTHHPRRARPGDMGPGSGGSGYSIGAAITHSAYADYQLLCMNDEIRAVRSSAVHSVHLAVLMTSHNRRARTLSALSALESQQGLPAHATLGVHLVDAGSTDGTPEAVRLLHPSVEVMSVGADVPRNQAMRIASRNSRSGGGGGGSHSGRPGGPSHRWTHQLWLDDGGPALVRLRCREQ
ncbi:hypothetical protein SCYAM73S_03942 [Streptomyces cyaneofuscatus]